MLLKCISAFITMTLLLVENVFVKVPESNFFEYVENKQPEYLALLKIPSINLEQPLYDIKNNDIDKNIIFLESSDMPTVHNGNVIIAGHSGASTVSYFKYLYKLKIGDLIYLEYNNNNYTYKIDYRYFIDKTGSAEIIRDNNTNTLTLITCYGKDKQLVLIAIIVK